MGTAYQNTTDLNFQNVWKMFQETDKKFKETDKQIKELGKQIGGLGNKFGSYTEGLFTPSLIKFLETKFNCTKTTTYYKFKDNGNSFEVDVLGISDDKCYIIEIKSHLKFEAIEQVTTIINNFKKYSDEYADKPVVGILVATSYDDDVVKQVIKNGFYFVSAADDIVKLKIPKGFKPKIW